MHAVVFDAHGPPDQVLRVEHLDDPRPGPGQVVVAVEAAPIHPSDLLTVQGLYAARPRFPAAVPGNEGVGRVVQAGDGVSLPLGTRVLLPLGIGTWRSHVVATARHLVPVPADADALQLAMAVVNPGTALLLLQSFMDLYPGEWIVQNAANGAVGQLVATLARARGLRTVNLVRRDDAAAAVRAAGGDVVLTEGDDVHKLVKTYTDDAQIRLAFDAVAGPATHRLARCLAHGGTVVGYGAMSGGAFQLGPDQVVFRDIQLRGFWLTTWFQQRTEVERAALVATLLEHLGRGEISSPVAATYALTDIVDAVRHAASGARSGKVLLVPTPDA